MDLIGYVHEGWAPLIRPAPATRPWMDATAEKFAYRCLPLDIANAHGWEVLNPCGVEAVWDGGNGTPAVATRPDAGAAPEDVPVSIFGNGVLTFHIEAIFRTPPGWNLFVTGSTNRMKDAIAPLGGVIETDWSPYTFTMNWRFTRPHQSVRFEAREPICFFFPVERASIEAFNPALKPLSDDPATAERFAAWSAARDAFHGKMQRDPGVLPSDRWQKHYYRGVDVAGESLVKDHKAKLRLKDFDRTATPGVARPPADDAALIDRPAAPSGELAAAKLALARREWLLEVMEAQRALAPATMVIERRAGLSSQEFLDRYYAVGRPVILTGEMSDWPALERWTPEYLKAKIGEAVVEYQGGRTANPEFELDKEAHRRTAPFSAFIDTILAPGAGNETYLTAYNSAGNATALAQLEADMGPLDKFLDPGGGRAMPWIGPAGTLTSLHHDLTNNLIAQVVGRKRVKLLPAAEAGKLYNHRHVFSEVPDLEAPDLDLRRFPLLRKARIYDVTLAPGEVLFVPVAWWHQVRSLDFSVTLTFTNFHWRNDMAQDFPQG